MKNENKKENEIETSKSVEEIKKDTNIKIKSYSRPIFERKINLKKIESVDDFIGKILFFKKENLGIYEQYKLYSEEESKEFQDLFFLHPDNTREIRKQFPNSIPEFVSGQAIEIKISKGDYKYNLQSGTKIVFIKIEPQ